MADEEHESSKTRLITLFASGDQVFVWNADEALLLRSKYRIVGSLVGSLPRKPKQNLCLSLPLVLMREEATLLLEKSLARIVDGSKVVCKPSAEEVEKFNTLRDQSVKNQLKLFRKEREQKERELSDVIESGRKRKRRQDETAGHQAKLPNLMKDSCEHDEVSSGKTNNTDDINKWKANTPHVLKNFYSDSNLRSCREQEDTEPKVEGEDSGSVKEETVVDQKRFCLQVNESQTMASEPFADEKTENGGEGADVVTDEVNREDLESQSFEPGASAVLYHISTTIHLKSIPQKIVDWTYPNTEDEKLHYKTFLDLWENGYYITSGAKFGGDYLAYPGDPARFHSFYIIVVFPQWRKVTPFDIISLGRLGSTVKKTAVFCSVNEDDQVTYTSVKWTGIS